MVDLKRTSAEVREEDVCCVDTEDKYPWGLRIHLQTAEIEKLNLGLPEVGSTLTFTAEAVVQEVSSRESEGKGGKKDKRQTVELQVTSMDIPNVSNDDDVAARLYPGEQ